MVGPATFVWVNGVGHWRANHKAKDESANLWTLPNLEKEVHEAVGNLNLKPTPEVEAPLIGLVGIRLIG